MLFLAHYLDHFFKGEEQPALNTNCRGKAGSVSTWEQKNGSEFISNLEKKMVNGAEHIIITNGDGEIVFEKPANEKETGIPSS